MISVVEAKKILSENIRVLPDEKVSVVESSGRRLSKDIITPMDVPSFNNAAMDGYAFCYEPGKTDYRVSARIQAGDPAAYTLQKDEAARIFTGAPVPEGADTVIQQELTTVKEGLVSFNPADISKGKNVRLQGAQCKAGETIIPSGTPITPGVIALLHSVGAVNVRVYQKPKVAVIVTGNELVDPGRPLQNGEVYNANQAAISSYLGQAGINPIRSVHVKDDPAELKTRISCALKESDMLILSGGISVGEYDFVHKALADEGVQTLFYKIRQKPGKPLFAGKKGDRLIFGLPGNPAAVLTCFNQYVKPCLQLFSGDAGSFSCSALLPLAHDWKKKTPLANILKARVKNGEVTILGGQDSFNLLPFADANAFVLLYEDDMVKRKGALVEVYDW